jgi:hypothetical protein
VCRNELVIDEGPVLAGKVGNDAAPALERDPGVPPRDTATVDLAGAVAAPDSSALDASVMARACGPLPE